MFCLFGPAVVVNVKTAECSLALLSTFQLRNVDTAAVRVCSSASSNDHELSSPRGLQLAMTMKAVFVFTYPVETHVCSCTLHKCHQKKKSPLFEFSKFVRFDRSHEFLHLKFSVVFLKRHHVN